MVSTNVSKTRWLDQTVNNQQPQFPDLLMCSQAVGCCDSHTVVYWAWASICFVLCLTFSPFFNPRSRYADWQDGGGDQRAHQEHGPVEDHRKGAERCHQPRHQGAGEDDQQTGYAAEEERRVHEEDQRAGLTPSGGLWEVPDPHTKTGTHVVYHSWMSQPCLKDNENQTCYKMTKRNVLKWYDVNK